MSLELGVWRIDGAVQQVQFGQLAMESRLEDILAADISIASPDWMVVGRQVRTAFGSIVDLLVLDSLGHLVVVELKRDKTPRDIIAQVLDYGAWVKDLQSDEIARIFDDYQKRYGNAEARKSLDQAFRDRFKGQELPEELNEEHQLVVVASALDPATERVVNYLLNHHGVKINAIFFRVFKDEGREYLARVWLQDPFAVEAEPTPDRPAGDWNGEYYGSFGGDGTWEDAVQYGFFGGGGGRWYSNTLGILNPGDRIWVNKPGVGYLGVGVVEETVVPCDEFLVPGPAGKKVPIVEVAASGKEMTLAKNDPDRAEYLVRVRWLKTVTEESAIKEKGFFGNQNTVARPTADRWNHTVERLKSTFGLS